MTDIVDRFRGSYAFLSNFYPAKVRLDGEEYPTIEHAYQAAKTQDPLARRVIRIMETPALARAAGHSLLFIKDYNDADWKSRRTLVVLDLLRQKFLDTDLKNKLLATGDALLVEGNNHGDTFWGQVNGKGENMLGVLLMVVRGETRKRSEHWTRWIGGSRSKCQDTKFS